MPNKTKLQTVKASKLPLPRMEDTKRDARVTAYVAQHAFPGTGIPTGAAAPTETPRTLKDAETPGSDKFWKGVDKEHRAEISPPSGNWNTLRRPTSAALSHVNAYNAALGLDPQTELPEKHAVLAASTFTFLRANPALAELDFRSEAFRPLTNWFGRTPPTIWSSKDTHVGNFGFFRGPDGKPVLSVNDFDMAGRGTPEADVARLLTSALVMMTERGIPDRMEILESMARKYFSRIVDVDGNHDKYPPYLTGGDIDSKVLGKLYSKAAKTTQTDVLEKFFVDTTTWEPNPEKALVRLEGPEDPAHPCRRAEVEQGIANLEQRLRVEGVETPGVERPLRILEMFRKHESGGSSVGMERLYIVLAGTEGHEPTLLEAKMLMPSPANCVDGNLFNVDAEEVLHAQHQMESKHYPLVSTFTMDGRVFYTRERERQKKNVALATLPTDDLKEFLLHAADGLARLHTAPAPDEMNPAGQAQALKDWVGGEVDKGVKGALAYAVENARQTFADHAAFCHDSGRSPDPIATS